MDEKEVLKDREVVNTGHHHSHGLKITLVVIGILFIFAGIAGIAKLALYRGLNQGSFGGCFAREHDGFNGRMMGDRIINEGSYPRAGLIGKIISIDGDNITVHKDSNNKDYAIVISETTQIRKDNEIIGKSDLANGQAISVQGKANSSGQISASFIIIN